MKIDIAPGWQGRLLKLRKTIRECKHTGKRLDGANGDKVCAKCGLRFEATNRERKS